MTDRLPASLSGKKLAREIMASASPETTARSLPAQSLYFALQEQGLESSVELLEVVSNEQTRIILDLDLWTRDRFHEERFWEWLALPDASESLEILQKVLKNLDLKLAALLIGRYVDVQVFEESTDSPPGHGYFTPDKGKTWIMVQGDDGRKHFLLSRFLALLFETSTELFYQLLAIPNVATDSMLEEEAYQERVKRLLAEGFPDPEQVSQLHQPIALESGSTPDIAPRFGEDTPIVSPILTRKDTDAPLIAAILESIRTHEEFQSELTYITNAAIVHFNVDLSDRSQIQELIEGVRGVLNLGLESLQVRLSCEPQTALMAYGLVKIYRIGLGFLFETRTVCRRALSRIEDGADPEIIHVLQLAAQSLPRAASYLSTSGTLEVTGPTRLASSGRALSHLAELTGIQRAAEALTLKHPRLRD